MKLVTLIALASCWRPRSDLERIRYDNVSIEQERFEIIATQPKEGDFKRVFIYKCSMDAICPVECIKTYLARTNDIRKSNDAISHLFITTTEPHRNADGDSIANWIKRLMRENGMNSNVHALRALSSSHALFNGHSRRRDLEKRELEV